MEGSVVLTQPSAIEGLAIYQYNDYPELELTIGPQWTSYLDGSYTPYLSFKQNMLDEEVALDAVGSIVDMYSGTLKFPLTISDTSIPVGFYMCQVQLRKPNPNPDLQPLSIKIAGTGRVYVGPLFKMPGVSSVPPATGVYVRTIVADDVLTVNDFYVLADGTLTVTLPTAVGIAGKLFRIKNIGTGAITVAAPVAETIDGQPSTSLLTQYSSVEVVSSGTEWILV